MIRRPPRSTPLYSSAASDVYKRQIVATPESRELLESFSKANQGSNDMLLTQLAVNYGYKIALENIADEIQAQYGI